MNETYIDLHTHTLLSDGALLPETVVARAYGEGIRHIALTDHNRIHTNLEKLRALYTDMEIISGSEISCEWNTLSGDKKEIHIIGLYLEQTDELKTFLQRNCDDGVERLEKMLAALKKWGVTFGDCITYQAFQSRFYPERTFISRLQLAEVAVQEGYAATVDQFMDEFIGDYGLQKAYIPSSHAFASMEEVIHMIHKSSGVAVLAHPMSYKLSNTDVENLIDHFTAVGGDGLECYYSHYEPMKLFL